MQAKLLLKVLQSHRRQLDLTAAYGRPQLTTLCISHARGFVPIDYFAFQITCSDAEHPKPVGFNIPLRSIYKPS